MKPTRLAIPIAVLLIAPVGALGASAADDGPSDGLRERVEALLAQGPDGARAALDGFAERPLDERRALSLVVRDVGDERSLERVLDVVDDPDALVRRNLIVFLAQPDRPAAERRAEALYERARSDVERELRRLALLGLASIGGEEAVRFLVRGVRELEPEDRSAAAVALTGLPAGRSIVLELVREAFTRGAERLEARLADDVLAVLLEAYGQRLAETPSGGAGTADRVPLVLGRRHPSPEVRLACEAALDGFVARSSYLGRGDEADRVLARLIDDGYEPRDAWIRRAELALDGFVDLEIGRRAVAELRRRIESPHEDARLFRIWEVETLAAAVELLADRPDAAAAPVERARGACRAMIGLGFEDLPPNGQLASLERELLATRPEAFERGALVEVLEVVRLLAAGREIHDVEVLERAHDAHVLLLRAQLAGRRSYDPSFGGWERVLLGHRASPLRLFGAGRSVDGVTTERALALVQRACRAFASVAPRELIGFVPAANVAPSLFDPLDDPERYALLSEIQNVEKRAIDSRIIEITRLIDAEVDAGRPVPARLEVELRNLRANQRRRMLQSGSVSDELPRLRPPTDAGLRLAELLRVDGRTAEALELAERMRRDYDAREVQASEATLLLSSGIDQAIGAALTDLGRADEADRVLQATVARLEELEAELAANGFSARTVRFDRMNVLVSLAVNANVKLREPEKAVAYFERAYEIRQDDFMRVLLGCYRARAGQTDEARRAIRDVIPGPSTYYNLACTHALLGDAEEALDFLARDFAENHASASSLEHQQEWAREDPDLESLAGDPRFERLLELSFDDAVR